MGLKFRRGSTAQQSGSLAFGEPYVNTTLGTLVVGGATGDIVLSTSGTGSTGNFGAISGSGLDITGNANIAGNVTVGGQLTIGDQTSDTVNVVASLSSSLIPQTTNAFDLGSATKIWKDLYISTGSIKFVEGTSVVKTLSAATLTSLEAATGSSNVSITNLNSATASLNTSVSNLNTTTASLLIETANLESFTSSINTTIKTRLNAETVVSGSSQITYSSISFIPAGIVSGSSQITYSSISFIPAGIVSGSSQIDATATTNFATGVKTQLNSNTVVSGSSQITAGSTTNFATDVKTQLNSNTVVSGSSQVTLSSTTGGSTSSNVQFGSLGIGMAATGTSGRIDAANDIVAFSSSDIRFKENITPIENALDKISKISGNTYDWKAENKAEHGYEGNDVGVIAQEIEAVLPQLVQTRESGFKAVKYDKLVALLIEGIKEQQQNIDNLTIQVEELKKQKGL